MTFRELRERRGYSTIARLASVSRVQATTITKIESGIVSDPRYSTIRALAQALGVDLDTVQRAINDTVAA
jgi:transcriptional regulator with XRE-family HTH domain